MFAKADIEKYFLAEKAESKIFMLIGITGILFALVYLIFIQGNFYTGMAIPFATLGLLLGVVGYTVYKRSEEDIKRNVYAFDMNPGELKDKEMPRMRAVMKNFEIYRWTEIVLVLAGFAMFFYFSGNNSHEFLRGTGLGLAIMSFLALGADYFAEQRGKVYLDGLEQYTISRK